MLKSRVIIESFTHNNFKTFDACKRKYYYEYIKKMHWPNLYGNYELGLTVHKLLDYQAKGFNVDHFIHHTSEEVQQLWKILEANEIVKYQVVESEWAFNINLKPVDQWLEGRIDRIIRHEEEDKCVIVDFKTGQQLPSLKNDDWQATIYLYSISLAKQIDPDNLEFWYYKVAQDSELRKIQYSREIHQEYEEKIAAKVIQIRQTTFWPPSEACRYKFCQYQQLCQKT